jgi:ABC-type lipoprotein release transport system permease subunit
MIGVYGTVAYSVAQRGRELGIRMALGAVRTDILGLVIGQAMRLVGYGIGLGLILGAGLTRALTALPLDTTLLFGVSATDAVTFGVVTVLLAVVALAACYVPARRAARVDPVVTLRSSGAAGALTVREAVTARAAAVRADGRARTRMPACRTRGLPPLRRERASIAA